MHSTVSLVDVDVNMTDEMWFLCSLLGERTVISIVVSIIGNFYLHASFNFPTILVSIIFHNNDNKTTLYCSNIYNI